MLTKKDFELIKELSLVDLKLRYNSSILGFFWSFLNPLLMLSVLYIVFGILLKSDVEHYPLFLLLGIIFWNFFSECTITGMSGVLNKASLINKISFKKEILIISACLTAFYTLILNLLVFFIIMIISGLYPDLISILIIIPIFVIFTLSLGVSFFLSAFYMKYRDLNNIWYVLLQAGFFLTPIIYPISLIPDYYIKYYMLNPLTIIITESRNVLISRALLNFNNIIMFFFISFIILLIGYTLFKKREPYFTQEL